MRRWGADREARPTNYLWGIENALGTRLGRKQWLGQETKMMQAELGWVCVKQGMSACSCLLDQISHTNHGCPDHSQGAEFLQKLEIPLILWSSCSTLPPVLAQAGSLRLDNSFPLQNEFPYDYCNNDL